MNDKQNAQLRRIVKGEIESNYPLRTDEMDGWFYRPPQIGCGFRMFNDLPLSEAYDMRMIYTSDVVKIEKLEKGKGGWIIDTVTGSRYEIEIT